MMLALVFVAGWLASSYTHQVIVPLICERLEVWAAGWGGREERP